MPFFINVRRLRYVMVTRIISLPDDGTNGPEEEKYDDDLDEKNTKRRQKNV